MEVRSMGSLTPKENWSQSPWGQKRECHLQLGQGAGLWVRPHEQASGCCPRLLISNENQKGETSVLCEVLNPPGTALTIPCLQMRKLSSRTCP